MNDGGAFKETRGSSRSRLTEDSTREAESASLFETIEKERAAVELVDCVQSFFSRVCECCYSVQIWSQFSPQWKEDFLFFSLVEIKLNDGDQRTTRTTRSFRVPVNFMFFICWSSLFRLTVNTSAAPDLYRLMTLHAVGLNTSSIRIKSTAVHRSVTVLPTSGPFGWTLCPQTETLTRSHTADRWTESSSSSTSHDLRLRSHDRSEPVIRQHSAHTA